MIETLVVVGILTLVGLAVWSFQRNIFFYNNVIGSGFKAENDARKVVKQLASEIRSASMGNDGSYPISKASGDNLAFFSDTDSDGLKEKIRYFLEGDIVKRGSIVPSGNPPVYLPANEIVTIMTDGAANSGLPIFSYYNSSYDGTTASMAEPVDVSAIRLVKITIVIDESSIRAPAPMKITTQVSIRNLKDNL